MESEKIIGFAVLISIFGFFSWALGRFINKQKKKETNEFQNFISGAWILGLIILFFVVYSYVGK